MFLNTMDQEKFGAVFYVTILIELWILYRFEMFTILIINKSRIVAPTLPVEFFLEKYIHPAENMLMKTMAKNHSANSEIFVVVQFLPYERPGLCGHRPCHS